MYVFLNSFAKAVEGIYRGNDNPLQYQKKILASDTCT